jgi:acetyl esterase
MPLHPEFEGMIAELAKAGGSPVSELSVDDARAFIKALQPLADDLPVAHVDNLTIPGPAGEIPIRVYTPQGAGPFPVFMNFHGGGWVIGDLDTADSQCRMMCRGVGCLVVSVDYRLAPEAVFPAAADDCYAATCWVAGNAAQIDGDPERIAVGGDSAGGNLATVVALMARDQLGPGLRFQLLVCPVTDADFGTVSYADNAEGYLLTRETMRWFWDHYCPEAVRSNPHASPLQADDLSNLPPALVLTAEYDPLRDEGEAYAARLESAGVEVECVRYDGLIHSFFPLANVYSSAQPGMQKACDALRSAFAN